MTSEAERKSFWAYALVTVPVIVGIGLLMGQLSNSGYGNDWFDGLRKPELMPPGWVFGAAWTTLYILLGLALALVLRERGRPGWTAAMLLFGAQMLLNYSWSPIFFGAHRPELALFIIVLMLALSIAATFLFLRLNRAAGWLMVPYLAWLGFASMLNYRIIQLNPGA